MTYFGGHIPVAHSLSTQDPIIVYAVLTVIPGFRHSKVIYAHINALQTRKITESRRGKNENILEQKKVTCDRKDIAKYYIRRHFGENV